MNQLQFDRKNVSRTWQVLDYKAEVLKTTKSLFSKGFLAGVAKYARDLSM